MIEYVGRDDFGRNVELLTSQISLDGLRFC